MTLLDSILLIVPHAPKQRVSDLAKYFEMYAGKYGLNTAARKSAFWAQAAEETDGFNALKEYASGSAYEGRADLGNTQKGDGVKFKGRGMFQITGRNNYAAYSLAMFGDKRLLDTPELLEQPQYAVLSALIYWHDHNLNAIADKPDNWSTTLNGKTYNKFQYITKLINGGQNGEATRESYYSVALKVMKDNPISAGIALVAGGAILHLLSKS